MIPHTAGNETLAPETVTVHVTIEPFTHIDGVDVPLDTPNLKEFSVTDVPKVIALVTEVEAMKAAAWTARVYGTAKVHYKLPDGHFKHFRMTVEAL